MFVHICLMLRLLMILAFLGLIACASPPPAHGDYTLNGSRMHKTVRSSNDRGSHRSISGPLSRQRMAVVEEASGLIGVKYRYGGNTPSRGFDCSGFTSYVWSRFDVSLPRSSSDQARLGRRKSIRNAEEGDLIFFGTGTRVTHVGIVVDHRKSRLEVIHSTSSHGVRIDEVYSSHYWSSRALWAVDIDDIL
jgi:probable lipoprotein NlpC